MVQWRKTVYLLMVVHLLTSAGFNLVLPFLPLYVGHLGIKTYGTVDLWTGIIYAVPALTMMLASPLWGVLADRKGRKIMLVRSTLAGAIVLSAMGFVRSAEELALLRALQGLLTGNIAASNALVASTIPKERAGESFGLLRTGNWVGMGIGPLLGGIIGELFGFRQSFWVTGVLLAAAGLMVVFFVKEEFHKPKPGGRKGLFQVYASVLAIPQVRRLYSLTFLHAMGRSVVLPVIPFFMLWLMGRGPGVTMRTGLLFGLKAAASVTAALWVGRLGDRIGHGRVVVFASIMMVAFYLPHPFLGASWQFIALQTMVGFASVGIVPGVGALLSMNLPEGMSGATYGLEASVDALARTLGPMMGAAMIAWFDMESVFFLVVGIYALLAVLAAPLLPVVAPRGAEAH